MSPFFDFVRTSLLKSKKLYFLSIISKNVCFWLFFLQKTYKKKVDFLTKTIDTLLQNADFLEFFRTSLFRSKKHSLLSRISKNVSFLLCLPTKKHIRTRSNFCKNHVPTPLENVHFFEFART